MATRTGLVGPPEQLADLAAGDADGARRRPGGCRTLAGVALEHGEEVAGRGRETIGVTD